jgi:hypothetical protein
LGGQTKQLISEAFELIYYMKGSVSYNEIMEMTMLEKQLMSEFIQKQLENDAKMMKNNPLMRLMR